MKETVSPKAYFLAKRDAVRSSYQRPNELERRFNVKTF